MPSRAVYDRLNNQFDCGAFVSVGQNADMKKVLRDILHELDKKKYKDITASKMDVKQLIDEVRGFLGDKRYAFNPYPHPTMCYSIHSM